MNAAAAARIASGATPNAARCAIAARAFDTLWAPGMASSAVGMIRPPGPVAAVPPPAIGSLSTPSATIQPSTTPSPPGIGRSRRYMIEGVRPSPRVSRDDRVFGVEDHHTVRVDQLGQAALHPAIVLDGPVPVEVVRGDVRVDGDRRPPRQRRQLELGELIDDPVAGCQLEEPLDHRHADVPAEDDRVRWIGRKELRGERRRRRLALCPGDARRRGGTQPQEESASDTSGGAVRSPASRARHEIRRAARRDGSVVGKYGVIDGDVATSSAPAHVAAASTLGPEGKRDVALAERRDGIAQLSRGPPVVDRHASAGVS